MIDDIEIPDEMTVGTCEACKEPKLRDELAHSWHPLGSGTPECLAGQLAEAYFVPAEDFQQRQMLVAAMNENFRKTLVA